MLANQTTDASGEIAALAFGETFTKAPVVQVHAVLRTANAGLAAGSTVYAEATTVGTTSMDITVYKNSGGAALNSANIDVHLLAIELP